LDIEEDEECFSVTYKLQSKLWSGTTEQQMVLAQSRGTIFSKPTAEHEGYSVLCLPFVKFWSVGEKHAAQITEPFDSDSVQVLEKLDGTMTKLFYHNETWRLASNSKLVTDEPRKKRGGRSTREAFEKAVEASGINYAQLLERLDCCNCYMFELLDPNSVIVVPVPEYRIVHIGTRNMDTLHEVDVDIGIEKPRAHPECTSMRDCLNAAGQIPWHQGEGFVVTDKRSSGHSRRRVKVKSRAYLRVHNATTNVVAGDVVGFCLDTWLNCESSEILAYFPQFEDAYTQVTAAIEDVETGLVGEWQKQFNEFVGEAGGGKDKRAAFYQKIGTLSKQNSPVALYKRMFDLYERSLELDEIAAVLRGEVNQGVHLFRKILKTQLLLCLPVEITEAEIFGKRGEKRNEDGANCEGAKY